MAAVPLAPRRRRIAALLLAAVAFAAIAGPAGVAAEATTDPAPVDEATLTAQESAMVGALNEDRTDRGLVAVRVDSRLMAIARARSEDMAANGYFSHTQPDGRSVFDILNDDHIAWYGAGEIIAWNTYPMESTVSAANEGWLGSAGHAAIVTSTNYNYVGVGLAVDASGKKIWTAVFLKGPDRTAAKTTPTKPSLGSWRTSKSRTAKVSWTGYDPRLQVLTAGLRSFTVQLRVDSGAWRTLSSATTATAWTFTAWKGHRYEFRISALDRAGNRGSWVSSVVDLR